MKKINNLSLLIFIERINKDLFKIRENVVFNKNNIISSYKYVLIFLKHIVFIVFNTILYVVVKILKTIFVLKNKKYEKIKNLNKFLYFK